MRRHKGAKTKGKFLDNTENALKTQVQKIVFVKCAVGRNTTLTYLKNKNLMGL